MNRATLARFDQLETELAQQDRAQKDAQAWRRGFLERAGAELQQPAELLERAEAGDEAARATLAAVLAERPAFVAAQGSFLRRAEDALLDATSGGSWLLRQTRRSTLKRLQDGIAGPSPTPIEAELAHCLAMSLVESEHLATLAHRGNTSDALDRRRTRAHARAMSAARTLATVRRLALPMLQVNLAQQQVNVGTMAAATSRRSNS